jgi:hypothetical protein
MAGSWHGDCQHLINRRCNMAVKDPPEIDENTKPSQAEGERNQPGEDQKEKEFEEPLKPSQAEGERKPYQ